MDERFLYSIELGVGTWQWGDKGTWGFGRDYADDDVRAAFQASLQAGLSFFDTAEVYGLGRSERLLGRFLKESGKPALVATKFLPLFFRLRRASLLGALRGSLRRLGLAQVDLYQIHFPFPPVSIETWMAALAEAVQEGMTRAVGVSNYDLAQTRRAVAALSAHGVRLASNQVHYSLLHRQAEDSGLLGYCREQGIRLIAYSPLEKGILSGKYSATRPPPGKRGQGYPAEYLARIEPLLTTLRKIADARGKTPSQVACNWVICQGALAIPGAKNARQARENAGAVGWRLDEGERAELDRLSRQVGGPP
jgi:aryl-alcohol dehydrogenase-like predicted oxidoreductase